jgi:hypothetical protein
VAVQGYMMVGACSACALAPFLFWVLLGMYAQIGVWWYMDGWLSVNGVRWTVDFTDKPRPRTMSKKERKKIISIQLSRKNEKKEHTFSYGSSGSLPILGKLAGSSGL